VSSPPEWQRQLLYVAITLGILAVLVIGAAR
jgi:hypothetical protein